MDGHSGMKINPLLIDLVLDKVFTSLKTQEIKSCRLVCKQWCHTGFKVLCTRCKKDVLFGDSTRSKDIQAFTKASKFITQLPFNSFTLQPSVFSLKRSQTIEEFFQYSSHFMKTLALAYQDHSHYLTLSNRKSLLFHLPNLAHLRFEVLPIAQTPTIITLSAVTLFKQIFTSAENLKRLELIVSTDISQGTSTAGPYISTICSTSQRSHKRLKELVINAYLNDTQLDSLVKVDYQFEMLHVRFRDSDFIWSSPIDLFQTQAYSLKRLKIDPWVNFTRDIPQFPKLPHLTSLEVLEWKPFSDTSPLPFKFTYRNCFPNLKKLSFQCHQWQDFFIKFFPMDETVKTVKELKLPKHIGIDSSMLVRRISNLFPMLVKLEIAVNSESVHCLHEIFRLLKNLQDLTISFVNWNGTKCIDYIFTGIPESICKQIYSMSDMSTVDLSNVCIQPSLRDLKYLTRLQLRNMSMFSQKGRPQYTDITGFHGMCNLSRLSFLSIWPSQMTKDCVAQLKKRFKVTLHSF